MNIEDYPVGADTSKAPWNLHDNIPIQVEVEAFYTLTRKAEVTTQDYEATPWDSWEADELHGYNHIGGTDYSFKNTDFVEAYEQCYLTPLQLIKEYQEYLEKELKDAVGPESFIKKLKHKIESCKNWTNLETCVEKAD